MKDDTIQGLANMLFTEFRGLGELKANDPMLDSKLRILNAKLQTSAKILECGDLLLKAQTKVNDNFRADAKLPAMLDCDENG